MRWTQTALAVLSVALGVAAFATVAAIDLWQRAQIRALSDQFAADVLVVRRSSERPVDFAYASGQNLGITFNESLAMAELEGVQAVAYRGAGSRALGGVISIQREPVSESIFEVLGLSFAAGEAFTEEARLLDLPLVVLGAAAAIELFGGAEAAVGEVTDLGHGQMARVEGVLEPVPPGIEEFQSLNATALVPASDANNYHPSGRPAGTSVFVRHEPGAGILAANAIEAALAELPVGPVYEVVSSEEWLSSQRLFRNQVADELTRTSGWVVLLALIATVGNLANTLGLRALDRARSMAVRRAFGATRSRIFREILLDGLTIGGTGVILGLALWPILGAALRFAGQEAHLTLDTLLLAGAAGLGVTLLAVLIPAFWSLKLPIYRALRDELSPPVWEGVALTGMAAGVLALVVASSIGTGAQTWFSERLAEIGADRIVMTTIGGPADRRTSVMSPPPIDERDVSAIREVPGVLDIATATQDPAMAVVLADSGEVVFEPAVVTRVSETFFEVNPKPIFAGGPPESADEVIIGPTVANSVYPELAVHEVVGLPIELGRQSGVNLVDRETHTISGVFAPRPWESFGDIFDGAIVRFVRPSDPPMTASTGRDMHIRIDLTADYGAVLDDIRVVVDARHEGFGAAVIHEPAGDLSLIRDTMIGVGRAWVTMAWISLMVGGAGLASVVIVRLVRSRSELALRRAMGATQVRVAALSTSMALRIAGYASLVGLILAAAVTYWVTTIAPWRFHWPVTESITSLLVALIVSLAAVIVPVLAFSRLPPWAVLKEE